MKRRKWTCPAYPNANGHLVVKLPNQNEELIIEAPKEFGAPVAGFVELRQEKGGGFSVKLSSTFPHSTVNGPWKGSFLMSCVSREERSKLDA